MLLYRLDSICNKSDRVDVTRKIQFLPERENMGPRNQILDNRGFRIQRNIFTRLSTKDEISEIIEVLGYRGTYLQDYLQRMRFQRPMYRIYSV